MVKQTLLFDTPAELGGSKYTAKIDAPIYEPSHERPHIAALCDKSKTLRLINQIEQSGLPDCEKAFLKAAAWRHAVFHYENIADYYAHATPEMQRLMEESALVIIDFDSAIERGYVRLCEEIRGQYLEEYAEHESAA